MAQTHVAHEHKAEVRWQRGSAVFTDRRYSRAHDWVLDGLTVPGSSAPAVVRVPLSREDAIDPEEALVASLASCHMLFFLDFAARDGFVVDAYRDPAIGVMGKSPEGRIMMTTVTLAPQITFSGAKTPSAADIARLHHAAHEHCYIANSVRFEVVIAQVPPTFT